jgi:N-acetyl-gamma-glutamyl-phosphate reductase
MSKKNINIAIIGATGYTGLDLVFLLTKHPKVNINYLCATKNLGKNISFFDKRIKKRLPNITSVKKINWNKVNLVFLSLPNGEAQKIINNIYYKYTKIKFIDLSADFRIKKLKEYKNSYNINHKAKNLIKDSIYSLSEFVKKEINNYRIIANPGCYPTSVQIPLVPLLKKKLIKNDIIIDSKSGYSGAGKNLEKKFTHKNLYSSTYAYSPKNHRHVIEIEQELKKNTSQKVKFTFNPHLLPTFRGILSSIYVELKNNSSAEKLSRELISYYKKDKFIKILKVNSNLGSGNVLNTNNCEISICNTRIKNKVVIFSAIDNLVKGASGQAIQNMNLLFNLPETLGLK